MHTAWTTADHDSVKTGLPSSPRRWVPTRQRKRMILNFWLMSALDYNKPQTAVSFGEVLNWLVTRFLHGMKHLILQRAQEGDDKDDLCPGRPKPTRRWLKKHPKYLNRWIKHPKYLWSQRGTGGWGSKRSWKKTPTQLRVSFKYQIMTIGEVPPELINY